MLKYHIRTVEDSLLEKLAELRSSLESSNDPELIGFSNRLSDLLYTAERIRNRELPLKILFMGEYSVGKSSIVNSLVGADVLPTDDRPTTRVVTVIRYGSEPKVEIELEDGKRVTADIDVLKEIKHFSDVSINGIDLNNIRRMHYYYPYERLARFRIIDVPGLGTSGNPEDDEVTWNEVDHADVVLWVLDASSPIRDTNKRAINVLKDSGIKIIGIINKADVVVDDLDRLVAKVKEVYGLDDVFYYSAKKVFEFREKEVEIQRLWEKAFSKLLEDEGISFSVSIRERKKPGLFSDQLRKDLMVNLNGDESYFSYDFREWKNAYNEIIRRLDDIYEQSVMVQLSSLKRDIVRLLALIIDKIEEHIENSLKKKVEIDSELPKISDIFEEAKKQIESYLKSESQFKLKKALYVDVLNVLKRDIRLDYEGIFSSKVIPKFGQYGLDRIYRDKVYYLSKKSVLSFLEKEKKNLIDKIRYMSQKIYDFSHEVDLSLNLNIGYELQVFSCEYDRIIEHLSEILGNYVSDITILLLIYSHHYSIEPDLLYSIDKVYNRTLEILNRQNIPLSLDVENGWSLFGTLLDIMIEEEYIIRFLNRYICDAFLVRLRDGVMHAFRSIIEKINNNISNLDKIKEQAKALKDLIN